MLEVLIGLQVLLNLCFELEDIGLILNDLFLSVFHVFVVLYSLLDVVDFLLDGFEEMGDEIQSVADVVIFALVEFCEVVTDVALVEEGVADLHFNNFIIYLQINFP